MTGCGRCSSAWFNLDGSLMKSNPSPTSRTHSPPRIRIVGLPESRSSVCPKTCACTGFVLARLDSNCVKGFTSRGLIATKRRMFYVYALHSLEDQGLYIGFSMDLRRRMAEHSHRASFATKYRGPWKLIYDEAYVDRHDAGGRERYLKSGSGRRFLRQQLRHYFEKFPVRQLNDRSRGRSHVSVGDTFTWLPRLDSNQE
jgi:putative endonuclease